MDLLTIERSLGASSQPNKLPHPVAIGCHSAWDAVDFHILKLGDDRCNASRERVDARVCLINQGQSASLGGRIWILKFQGVSDELLVKRRKFVDFRDQLVKRRPGRRATLEVCSHF